MTDEPEIDTDDLFEDVPRPYVATFTGRIPFMLGVRNNIGHTIRSAQPFVDDDAVAAFGERVSVDIRVFARGTPGLPLRADGIDNALDYFYAGSVPAGVPARFAPDALTDFEQWVTLSTPGAIARGENASDHAYLFHRCLGMFNVFIRSVMVATQEFRIRPITAQDFRPAVTVGVLIRTDTEWRYLTDVIVHPEFAHQQEMVNKPPFDEQQFCDGLERLRDDAPFVRTVLWRGYAEDALRRTGEASTAIVTLQTAAESLLFDLYRLLLVDEGLSTRQIDDEIPDDLPFATLVKSRLSNKLGGNWDITATSAPVGRYWEDLYLMRNRIVHGGFSPHFGHSEQAKLAYVGLTEFVMARVHSRARSYPRTLLALLGEDGLEKRGWNTRFLQEFTMSARGEPGQYFMPWDEDGRGTDPIV
jgi:hypothetical protein